MALSEVAVNCFRPDRTPTLPAVVVGDSILDVDILGHAGRLAPDAPVPVVEDSCSRPRPGGAALAATLMAGLVDQVTLITSMGTGRDADQLNNLLPANVALVNLAAEGQIPVKTRIRVDGQPIVRFDVGGFTEISGALSQLARRAVAEAGAVLVSDYGGGVASHEQVRRALYRRGEDAAIVWDPHPRGCRPVRNATLVKPNLREAASLGGDRHAVTSKSLGEVSALAQRLSARWNDTAVCITLGSRGALLFDSGTPLVLPAAHAATRDTCGAGDCFAAAATAALSRRTTLAEAVELAVSESAEFLHRGGVDQLPRHLEGPRDETSSPDAPITADHAATLADQVRSRGGLVVATGGCFDVLHVGHVRMLEASRQLGDYLIVALNSDESVRALKGASRPVVPAHDRARMLLSLSAVDAVVVFVESQPHAVIDAVRPDLWTKGGDYTHQSLPEDERVRSWGGQAVLLPFQAGYSTTSLLQRVVTETTGESAAR